MDRSLACCWLMLPPLISPVSRIGFLNIGNFLDFAVEHHAQTLAHVRGSEVIETLPALAG